MSLRELLEMPVIEEENADMPWLSPRQARDVNLAYFIYAPLALIPAVVSRSAGGRVWQAVLRALRPLARWRLRHGVYWFPFEKWLNNRFGYPMRHSSHEAFGPERDLPPAPLMGEALDPRPPLEPSSVA